MQLTLAQLPLPDESTISAALFWVFALISACSAVGVVMSRNIVRTAVCLLFTLLGVGALYFWLSAEFLAAVQLVVYAGGTLILIIFGVMLTSKSPFSRFEPKLPEVIIAISIGCVLVVTLVLVLLNTNFNDQPIQPGPYPMTALGQTLLGDYLVPFELASVLLLVVMIGAAYLAKGRRRESDSATESRLSDVAKKWS
jgi:NADH-quinone oxidoreductase subunit J